MIDILYCCDENYSKQLQCSMFTILQNVDEPVTFHIIHKSNFTKNAISKYVTSHKQIHEIKYYEFSEKLKDFPNIQDAHVSEATYYRLFMDKYIPKRSKRSSKNKPWVTEKTLSPQAQGPPKIEKK